MKALVNRLYSDYLMPSRLGKYEEFIIHAKKNDYQQMSIRDFFSLLQNDTKYSDKTVIHRHDVDSDLRTARKIFEIEVKHGIKSSFYFRISTLDIGFMREIESYGSEASYHYEEIASFAKSNHIKCPVEIRKNFQEIKNKFEINYKNIETMLGKTMITVASHGDFANRRLNIVNHEILNDPDLRQRCGIVCESYDKELLSNFDIYISDRPHPQYFYPVSPFIAIGKYKTICFLTHPIHWETNWIENTKSNIYRLYEELRW